MIQEIVRLRNETVVLGALGSDVWYRDSGTVYCFNRQMKKTASYDIPEKKLVHLYAHRDNGRMIMLSLPGSYLFDTERREWTQIPNSRGVAGFTYHSFSVSPEGFWIFGNYLLTDVQYCCGICDRDILCFDLKEREWTGFPTLPFHGRFEDAFDMRSNSYSNGFLYGLDKQAFYKVEVSTGAYSRFDRFVLPSMYDSPKWFPHPIIHDHTGVSHDSVWLLRNEMFSGRLRYTLFRFDDSSDSLESSFRCRVDFSLCDFAPRLKQYHNPRPVNYMAVDRFHGNRLWLGTLTGLRVVDIDEELFIRVAWPEECLEKQGVVSIHIDQDTGDIWFSTANGIFVIPRDACEAYIRERSDHGRRCELLKPYNDLMFFKPV